MHVWRNLTSDFVSAKEDEGATEDDFLESEKGKGRDPRIFMDQ